MNRIKILILIIAIALISILLFLKLHKTVATFTGAPGQVIELNFELDKKFEFGEYVFNLANGKNATYPLCYCLTERNTYPPDCAGDVKYIYQNFPGTLCMPLNIGTGRCSVKSISSQGHETVFIIPLEYQWTKPFEKIVMGIKVPENAPENARLVVEVNIFKRDDKGKLALYRNYQQMIEVEHQNKKFL